MAKTKNTTSSANDDKPAKKLKKVEKPIKRNIETAMVINTIKELTSKLEDGVGAPLVQIRNYIADNFGFRMGKNRQLEIKEIMSTQFGEGKIGMTNSESEKINFTKRFEVMDDDSEEEEQEQAAAASAN